MLNKIFNLIPSLRLMYYNLLLEYVRSYCHRETSKNYLCWYHPVYTENIPIWSLFVCWKKMKECKELSNHESILFKHRGNLSCNKVMFLGNEARERFLKDCIKLLKENYDV